MITMKKQLLCLLLALMLPLVPMLAESAPTQADPVLATVNELELTKSQVEALMPEFLQQQYIADATEYRAVLDVMIRREIMQKKIKDLGFDTFTQQEEDAFAAEAQQQWDEALAYYADYFQSDESQEARDAALSQAEATFTAQGFSLAVLQDSLREKAGVDKLSQYLMGDYQPTQEEVQAVFQQIGTMYQQTYENDVPQYEYMTQYSGQTSWYTPEGYRGIVHILLTADDGLTEAYQSLLAQFEEQQQTNEIQLEGESEAASEPQAEAVTQEMVDTARQAVLTSRQADIDMIYERLGRGESFLELIKEYGEDPGMTVESNLAEGYAVHEQSVIFDPVFTAAAFSEGMNAPGDVSQPVVGSYGIHILQYLRDVPSGLIMTETIQHEIEDYLVSLKENEVFGSAFDTWLAQENVVYNEAEIEKATQEAAAFVQSPEELPLEALPGQTEDEGDE